MQQSAGFVLVKGKSARLFALHVGSRCDELYHYDLGDMKGRYNQINWNKIDIKMANTKNSLITYDGDSLIYICGGKDIHSYHRCCTLNVNTFRYVLLTIDI